MLSDGDKVLLGTMYVGLSIAVAVIYRIIIPALVNIHNTSAVVLAILLGLATIPGAFLGARYIQRATILMKEKSHK